MPTRQELERKPLTELAVLCQRVADDPSAYAEKARQLRLEWVSLQSPPSSDFKKQKKIEAQKVELKKRMVDFLAGTL